MRKIITFVPAAFFTFLFCCLTFAFREFNLYLFLLMAVSIASGVLSCLDKHILSLVFGLIPSACFVYGALTAPSDDIAAILLWMACAIALFYVCCYVSVAVYHRELNKY